MHTLHSGSSSDLQITESASTDSVSYEGLTDEDSGTNTVENVFGVELSPDIGETYEQLEGDITMALGDALEGISGSEEGIESLALLCTLATAEAVDVLNPIFTVLAGFIITFVMEEIKLFEAPTTNANYPVPVYFENTSSNPMFITTYNIASKKNKKNKGIGYTLSATYLPPKQHMMSIHKGSFNGGATTPQAIPFFVRPVIGDVMLPASLFGVSQTSWAVPTAHDDEGTGLWVGMHGGLMVNNADFVQSSTYDDSQYNWLTTMPTSSRPRFFAGDESGFNYSYKNKPYCKSIPFELNMKLGMADYSELHMWRINLPNWSQLPTLPNSIAAGDNCFMSIFADHAPELENGVFMVSDIYPGASSWASDIAGIKNANSPDKIAFNVVPSATYYPLGQLPHSSTADMLGIQSNPLDSYMYVAFAINNPEGAPLNDLMVFYLYGTDANEDGSRVDCGKQSFVIPFQVNKKNITTGHLFWKKTTPKTVLEFNPKFSIAYPAADELPSEEEIMDTYNSKSTPSRGDSPLNPQNNSVIQYMCQNSRFEGGQLLTGSVGLPVSEQKISVSIKTHQSSSNNYILGTKLEDYVGGSSSSDSIPAFDITITQTEGQL